MKEKITIPKKRLLVTGASGFLGWNLCQEAKDKWDIYGTVYSHPIEIEQVKIIRIDLTDYDSLKKMFHEVRPDAVIHTAAASNPNYCQTHRTESEKINLDASIYTAGLCADHKIPCVFTSTDSVFNGLTPPYKEDAPVSPINIYGEQKACAEEGMLKRYPKTAVCRMPLMFGLPSPASASFIQPMIKAMREGGELKLFTDEYRTPVSGKTASQGLLLALEKLSGILHLGGRERISRYDFGKLVQNLLGLQNAVLTPCMQKDVAMPASRPPDLSLDSSKAVSLGYKQPTLADELKVFVG
ncbi:MAG: NAD(P)-dependent oxidoreductase [Nitrospirae bacterium]|nr:NAD(P)-dependent oxidoreductase [Nitrospirota bacterium]